MKVGLFGATGMVGQGVPNCTSKFLAAYAPNDACFLRSGATGQRCVAGKQVR